MNPLAAGLKILVATTWHPLDGLPTYCSFTQGMIQASREAGLDVDLVRPVPWFRWHQQRRRSTQGGRDRFPISWKPFPGESKLEDARHHAKAVLNDLRTTGKQYDLLHVHGLDASLIMGGILSTHLGLPLVLHAHDSSLPQDEQSVSVLHQAARIIAVSENQKRLLLEAYPALGSKVRVIPNGVPGAFFECPRPIPPVHSGLAAVNVGRFIPGKGLAWLVANWKRIASEDDTLDLYGSGPQETELRQLVATLGLEKNIRFGGIVPNRDLPAVLVKYDAFLAPTHSETFGLANVEALAAGLALIVTDLPITREVLGGCTGVQFTPLEDLEAFRRAMNELRRMPPMPDAIRNSTRRYEIKTTIASLADHYVEVACSAHPRSPLQPTNSQKEKTDA